MLPAATAAVPSPNSKAPAAPRTFPKPDPEKVFAEMKAYDPATGTPWRVAREDWEGARRRVAEDPAWADWMKKERAAVDAWMARHRDRADWDCGWWHDFVSPKDGSYLVWDERIPGEEVSHLHSPSDPRVEITPKIMAAWVYNFRSRHAGMILRAARLYRFFGYKNYADWVAAQLDFYATAQPSWKKHREGAKLFWQTLDIATSCTKYAQAVRLLGEAVAPERRRAWKSAFFDPQVATLNATQRNIHNIATWHRCAVAQIALVFGDESLWREAIDGAYGLRRQMDAGITSDYLWYEQSLGYNSYVVQAVCTLFTEAGIAGRVGELAREMAVSQNLMLSTTYLRFPNGLLPVPADSSGRARAPNAATFAAAYRVFPTEIGLREAARLRDWDTLVDPPPALPADVAARKSPVIPDVASRHFESSRMALLKEGPWQVFFHYGQLTRSHAQHEALNFSATCDGVDITHDTGTVGYGSPLHAGYYTRGLNHNVPLFNGEGGTPAQAGELLAFSPSAPARVAAAQPTYNEASRAKRTLTIEGDALVDTATIEAANPAAGPQRLGLALHLQGKVRLPAALTPDTAFAAGRPAAFSHWREARGASFRDSASFDVAYEKGLILRVTIAVPGEFRVWHASVPDAPPRRRSALYVETLGTAATFTTTFVPVR